jgi:predicted DNA-binding protein (UPF0251 family)
MRFRAYLLVERFGRRRFPAPVAYSDPWAELEWHQHREAIEAVRLHPEGMTLEQIGTKMGITRERVRQIEGTALRKLIECTGSEVIDIGQHTFAAPDCERCSRPFVRSTGSDRWCVECSKWRDSRRRRY